MAKSTRTRAGNAEPPRFLFGGELSTPVRLAYGLVPMIDLLESCGEPLDGVLAAAEIPRFALEEPSFRITLAQELEFTRLTLRRVERAGAALEVGRRFHLPMFGMLGLAAACAPSLRESFHIIVSYPALIWGLIEITVWRRGGEEYIAFEPGAVVGELGPYFVERDMAAILMLFRNVLGTQLAPGKVMMRHARNGREADYAALFRCPVSFEAEANEMHFDQAAWNAVPPQANAMSRRFFENQCRRLSETLNAPFLFADIVRSRLRTATPMPSLPRLAEALHMTERTLQRRLASERTGFTAVQREVRIERARDLMRRRGVPIEEIAYRLGFTDPDAFSRAFRHWTGLSPTEHRRRSGTGPGA